jgi:hypothetical protein
LIDINVGSRFASGFERKIAMSDHIKNMARALLMHHKQKMRKEKHEGKTVCIGATLYASINI